MKKIFLLISFLAAFFVSNAQYPVVQFLGSDSAMVKSRGGLQGRFAPIPFTDTTAANLSRISQYPGALIYTSGVDKYWYRNATVTGWIEFTSSGGATVNIYNSDGQLTGNRSLNGLGYKLTFDELLGFELNSTDSLILLNYTRSGKSSVIDIGDTIKINPNLGNLLIDTLNTTQDTNTYKPIVVDPITGRVLQSSYWYGSGGVSDTSVFIVDTLYNRIADVINVDSIRLKSLAVEVTTGQTAVYEETDSTLKVTIPQFDSEIYGVVPPSTGTTTDFLRADGTWAEPAGGTTPGLQAVTDQDSTITNSIVMGQTWDAAGIDTAQASGYESILTGTANLNGTTRYYINTAMRSRIRQTGTIYKARFYLYVKPPELSAFYIYVWRKSGGVWSVVDSQNVCSQLVGATTNTVYFSPGLQAREGDYVGYAHISSVLASFLYATANSGTGMYYTNSHPGTSGVNWTSYSAISFYVPIHVYMRSPQVIGIGNSIMAGHNLHWSYIEASGADSVRTTFMNKLATNSNISIQNMGIGSQWTQHIQARFKSDVTDAKPKYAIIEGGVNDIANGGILTSTIVSNYKKMLDSCIVNSIKPIIILVIPWTAGSNSQNQRIDSLNYTLDTMVTNSYPTGYIVDVRAAIGEFRIGGDAGNLWNLKSWANADGVHVTDSANSIIASYIGRIFNESAYRSDGISHNGNFFKYPKNQSNGTLQNDGSGNLLWGSVVQDGEYTPTTTNGTNVTSSTSSTTYYTRVGNVVTISGTISVSCTSSGISSQVDFTIPVVSNFSASTQASGIFMESIAGVASPGHGTASSHAANDRISITFTPRATGSLTYTFNVTYKVI